MIPFKVGNQYTRDEIYSILQVPKERQKGNWETGYNRWENDLYIFTTVGSEATGGFDYNNRWEGRDFVWYSKQNATLNQPLIQWMLHSAERVFIFTRPAVRNPFVFEGVGMAVGWKDTSPVEVTWRLQREFPEQIADPFEFENETTHVEGALKQITVNSYERNKEARRKCIEHYGPACVVCGFNFELFYGEIGTGFIHVHHTAEISSIGEEYEVDPINDLKPVCPNCHAMLHRVKPAMTIEELRTQLNKLPPRA